MGSLTSKPKIPKPAPIVYQTPAQAPAQEAAPNAEKNAADLAKAQEEEKDRMRKQRGRAATILSGTGDDSASGLSAKALLGGGY